MMTHYSQSNTCLHIQDEICYTKYNEKKGPFRTGIGFGEQGAPVGFAQPNVSWDA